jgi:hypothetical protein
VPTFQLGKIQPSFRSRSSRITRNGADGDRISLFYPCLDPYHGGDSYIKRNKQSQSTSGIGLDLWAKSMMPIMSNLYPYHFQRLAEEEKKNLVIEVDRQGDTICLTQCQCAELYVSESRQRSAAQATIPDWAQQELLPIQYSALTYSTNSISTITGPRSCCIGHTQYNKNILVELKRSVTRAHAYACVFDSMYARSGCVSSP